MSPRTAPNAAEPRNRPLPMSSRTGARSVGQPRAVRRRVLASWMLEKRALKRTKYGEMPVVDWLLMMRAIWGMYATAMASNMVLVGS